VAAAQSPAQTPAGRPFRTTTTVTYDAPRTTDIDLVGTPLLPRARGEARIRTAASGPVRIRATVRDMAPASVRGPEYLTYVLWAIPPRGPARNLGELRLERASAELEATLDVQTFALIVTAEPYYAVTAPSDVVALEHAVRQETRGRTSIATRQYETVPYGAYVAGARYAPPPTVRGEPFDMQQARNAVTIAEIAQAATFAPKELAIARRRMAQVEQLIASGADRRAVVVQARAAVRAAEDARSRAASRWVERVASGDVIGPSIDSPR
jgi:hypothetical protein